MPQSPVKYLLAAILATAITVTIGTAKADPVNAILQATYFEVGVSANRPDFGGSGTPDVAIGSALGPNGLPVAISGIADLNPGTNEITWWSPSLNSAIVQTGTGSISLPYSSNMYGPNSTGSNDGTYFETAVFQGSFSLAGTESVSFALGSDDDSFIYVDGILIGQNPGIHGTSTVDFTASNLAAGSHTLEVFYADREDTGAYLSLNLLSTDVVITPTVPEPASIAIFVMGILAIIRLRPRRS